MFKLMGLGELTSLETSTLLIAGVALALIVGWILDLIAGHVGFGILGNAMICLLAIIVGLIGYRQYIGEMSVGRLPMVMAAATASVMLHLALMVFLRRVLRL